MAAEFGHVLNEENGRPCRCGRRGCVEAYAADYAIVARAAEVLGWPPAADGAAVHDQIGEITRLAKQGDARLRQIFAEAGHVLGQWGDEVWAQGAAALVLSERFAGRRQSTGA